MQKIVVEILVCQQNKRDTIKTLGILQQLAIPNRHMEEVSMYFIIGLPKYERKSVIMIVVDRMKRIPTFSIFLIFLKRVLW